MSSKSLITGLIVAGLVAIGGGLALRGVKRSPIPTHTVEVFSDTYVVDREYRSMMGPSSSREIGFPDLAPPELLWVTGYRAEVVYEDGSPAPAEMMCHSNLDFDSTRHAQLFKLPVYHGNRLFTLSQGQAEIKFPEGFGLPFYSDESFKLTSQVLNLNPDGTSSRVRHRVAIDYVLDRDLQEPMKALFMTSGWGLKLLEGESGHFGVSEPQSEIHGEGCLPGEAAGSDLYEDGFARTFSGHWVVEPGREVNRTLVTNILKLPYDTRLHYLAAHLHPFAESVELRDLSTGETVYRSETEGFEDRIGLKRVDYFTSQEGVNLYRDHEYEVISTYNNTTDSNQDSMAVMLLYLRDKEFKKRPRYLAPVEHVEEPALMAEERLLLRTNHGDLRLALFSEAAPQHVERILEMARLGVYDGVGFHRVEPGYLIQLGYPEGRFGAPLTTEQEAAIRPIDAEFTDLPFRRLSVGMALNRSSDPNSAEASFFITLREARELDQQFTVIGRILGELSTLHRIVEVPRDGTSPLEPVFIEEALVLTRDEIIALRAEEGRSGTPAKSDL